MSVLGVSGAVAVSVGGAHACALSVNGTAKCWGLNDQGQLGNGSHSNSANAVAVVGL